MKTFTASYIGDSPELIGTEGVAGLCDGFYNSDSAEQGSYWYNPKGTEDCFYVEPTELRCQQ